MIREDSSPTKPPWVGAGRRLVLAAAAGATAGLVLFLLVAEVRGNQTTLPKRHGAATTVGARPVADSVGALLFLTVGVVAPLMALSARLRTAAGPAAAFSLCLVTVLSWAAGVQYFLATWSHTRPGSNPIFNPDAVIRDLWGALLSPLAGLPLVATMLLAPPFGGRRARRAALILGGLALACTVAGFVVSLTYLVAAWSAGITRTGEYLFGLELNALGIIVAAPVTAAAVLLIRRGGTDAAA